MTINDLSLQDVYISKNEEEITNEDSENIKKLLHVEEIYGPMHNQLSIK